jgi:hypothetical protein
MYKMVCYSKVAVCERAGYKVVYGIRCMLRSLKK